MEWLICFSTINPMLGCLLLKKFLKFNELKILARTGAKGEPMATPSL